MYLLGILAYIPVVVGVVVYIPDEVEVLIAQRVWEHDREAIMQQIKAATIVQTAWVRGGEGRKRKEGSEGRKEEEGRKRRKEGRKEGRKQGRKD